MELLKRMNTIRLKVSFFMLFLLQFIFAIDCFSQRLFLGIPADVSQLKVGDVIVVNTPPSRFSGKFVSSDELDALINFIKDIDFEVCIYVNEYILPGDQNKAYSDFVCEGLRFQLEEAQISNCTVVSEANQIPMINNAFITNYFPQRSQVEIEAILSRLDIVLTGIKGEPSNCKTT